MTSFLAWWRSRRFQVALELTLAVTVCVGGYRLAHRYLTMADAPTFITWELKPAVMLACGYGFTEPGAPSPAVDRFLTRKSGSISCQEFAWGGAPAPPLGIALANRYSLVGAAWAMRIGGVSWQTLDNYLALLFGLSMACIYGVFRTAAGRLLSVAGVIAVACSPGLMEILAVRDFIKLPCFAALWLVLGWLVRAGLRKGAGATVLPMAVGGALLGLGIGLRMDAMVFLPVFVAIALVVVPGYTWRPASLKAAAVAVFIAMFLLAGRPILTAISSGSNSAHVLVLGLMTPFDRVLAIDRAPYDIGAQYADGFAYAVIVSHGRYAHGDQLPILLGSANYDRIGNRLLGELAWTFPGDVVTRAVGATWQIFRYPFDWRIREQAERMPVFQETPFIRSLMAWRNWAIGPAAEREIALVLFVLVLAGAFNWRLGAFGLMLVLYFCGYSMMQFARRHVFHLDVIPIFATVLAVQLPVLLAWRIGAKFRESTAAGVVAAKGYAREMAIGVAVLMLALAAFIGAWNGLRWWQIRQSTILVDDTLSAPWTAATVTEEALADTMLVDGHPLPSWYDIYMTDQAAWKAATLLRVDGVVPLGQEMEGTGDLRLQYFKVTLEGRCQASEIRIGLKYTGSSRTFDYEFTRPFTVAVAPGRPSYVLTPAYYGLGPTWTRFDGFAVPAHERACVVGVEKADPTTVPNPVLALALRPEWRHDRLYQQLLDRPRFSASGSPVDPLPTEQRSYRSGWRGRANEALKHPMPPLDQWSASEGVSVTKHDTGFVVTGNTVASGYQLTSPPIDVPAGHIASFQIVGEITSGGMCVGILDGAQQKWLLAPTDAKVGLFADTGDYQQLRLVFSNCASPPGTFVVRSMTYEAFPKD